VVVVVVAAATTTAAVVAVVVGWGVCVGWGTWQAVGAPILHVNADDGDTHARTHARTHTRMSRRRRREARACDTRAYTHALMINLIILDPLFLLSHSLSLPPSLFLTLPRLSLLSPGF
jgi:hypothetical protein